MNIVIIDRGSEIPATKYGGTERVIWGLGYELSKMGHQITFIVPPGSSCPFGKVIQYLFTMHGNTKKGDILPLNTVFVSKNHAERNNSNVYVHNGLLWDDYPSIDLNREKKYLHFLGKASWAIKNLSGVAQIAVKSNNKLKVLSGERWKMYNFKRKPFYTLHPNIKYCGLVDNNQKMEIMQHSKGLVFPVNWDEPFGLAIIESLYAGCPVFGTKKGSLPELINEEIGFLSNDIDGIIEAVKTKIYDPKICHSYAIDNFNSKKMANNYLDLYNKILNGETLNKTRPYAK